MDPIELEEPTEGEYISRSSEGEIESDFDDTITSWVLHALKLIAYLMLIVL